MSRNREFPLDGATGFSHWVVEELKPACERIEVVGSIRRQKRRVKDIDILLVESRNVNQGHGGLFGEVEEDQAPPLCACVDHMLWRYEMKRVLNGKKHQSFEWEVTNNGPAMIKVELWIVTREEWGVAKMIRTGPAEYSQFMVTQKCKGGALPDGYRVQGNRIHNAQGNALETPEEIDVYKITKQPWYEPEKRPENPWRWRG